MGGKIDSKALGLDIGLAFTKWLTGAENLHYGLWDGLEVVPANLRTAQDRYTEKLFSLLPEGKLKILDIGGGAGETARKLLALGHEVEIVVPAPYLAERCRENAPDAVVHEATFEALRRETRFDVCLFSESFQYIPLSVGMAKAAQLLNPGGVILIADCFRAEAFTGGGSRVPGGGHPIKRFRKALAESGLEVQHDEEITTSVAPSIDLEQSLFHVFGFAAGRIDGELQEKRPRARWLINRAYRLTVSANRRDKLAARLNENRRTAESFIANNHYLMLKLRPPG
ncbi:MAG: methyltransferase domain-containing protein [Pseudomonadota bacterium]